MFKKHSFMWNMFSMGDKPIELINYLLGRDNRRLTMFSRWSTFYRRSLLWSAARQHFRKYGTYDAISGPGISC